MTVICQSYTTLISRYLDNAVDEAGRRRLLGHLQSCPRCAATLARYRVMETVLQRSAPIRVPSDGQARLFASLNGPQSPAVRSLAVTFGLAVASAALVALVLVISGSLLWPQSRASVGPAAPPTVIATDNTPYVNLDGMSARGPRPFVVGYRPSGQPIGSGPSADVPFVYGTLGDSAGSPAAVPVRVAGHLPPGVLVERIAWERLPGARRAYYLEMIFVLPNGDRYRLQEIASDETLPGAPSIAEEGTLLIAGRQWTYGSLSPHGPQAQTVRVLRAVSPRRTTHLEAAVPLEELVQALDWLR